VDTRFPESAADPAPVAAPDSRRTAPDVTRPHSGPAVLADLIAAGLVSHEMIGDPGRLAGEAEALRLLCALVAGPVWRIEPYHYAFRADPDGVPEERAAALEAALAAELGAGAVWVSATERPEAVDLDQPLLLLRAQGEAVQGALEAAGPELQAVIGARFAAATARLAAGAEPGTALDARLAAIETRQEAMLAALAAHAEAEQTGAEQTGGAEALGRLGATLGQVLQRLDAQAEVLHAHIAREDMVAGRLAELAAIAGAPAAFQETLGLTLAEFLARLEASSGARGAEAAPARTTQAG
jgi:hypothetical protein